MVDAEGSGDSSSRIPLKTLMHGKGLDSFAGKRVSFNFRFNTKVRGVRHWLSVSGLTTVARAHPTVRLRSHVQPTDEVGRHGESIP